MLSRSRVQQRYGDCLDRAITWLNKNNYPVYPKGVRVQVDRDDDNYIVSTSDVLHFQEWPRGHASKKRLDILVSVIETVSPGDESCIRAAAGITYFQPDGDVATAVESLHYDFCVPAQAQHPICHLQISNKSVGPKPASFRRSVCEEYLRHRCQTLRVPTAYVNLPGIFTLLAADHLSPDHWREFMRDCRTHFEAVPGLPNHPVVDRAVQEARLRAWGWYE